MGSSTGRTFIAMMLIKEMAEDLRKPLLEGGKRSIYLLDNGKNPKNSDTQKIAVIILKLEQNNFTTDELTQKV